MLQEEEYRGCLLSVASLLKQLETKYYVWIRKINYMSLLCYPLFLLYKLLNMFRATMCPSSGAEDCVVLSPRVGVVPWLQEGCQSRLAVSVSMEEFVTQRATNSSMDTLPASTIVLGTLVESEISD